MGSKVKTGLAMLPVFGIMVWVTIWRLQNPSMTETQTFLHFWPWVLGAIVISSAAMASIERGGS